jgi:hypothetical protein
MNRCCIAFFIFQVFVPFFLLSRPKQKYNPVIMKRSVAPEFLVSSWFVAYPLRNETDFGYISTASTALPPAPPPPCKIGGEARLVPLNLARANWCRLAAQFDVIGLNDCDICIEISCCRPGLSRGHSPFSCFPPSPCSLPHSEPHSMQLQRATSTASDKATQRRLGVTILFRLPPPCVHCLIAKPIS